MVTDKPFWLFAGEDYYAYGGMNDFMGAFPSLEEAMARVKLLSDDETAKIYRKDVNWSMDWWHITDIQDLENPILCSGMSSS